MGHANSKIEGSSVKRAIRYIGILVFVVLALLFLVFPEKKTEASVYKAFNYQGKLLDNASVAVANGNYSIYFLIYDDLAAGSCLWSAQGTCGSPTAKTIAVSGGIFSTMLGEAGDTALPDFTSDSYYLEVRIDYSGTPQTLSPRKRIGSVPQALNANALVGDGVINLTSGATTTNAAAITVNSLTTGNGLLVSSTSLSSGALINLSENGTAAASNTQKGINISMAGANGTATQTTYGGYISNTHTGTTSTNVGLYTSASGATNNYGLIVENGSVGIGTASPTYGLHLTAGPTLKTAFFSGLDASHETRVVIQATTNTNGNLDSNSPFAVKDSSGTTVAYIRQDGGMFSKFISTADNASAAFVQAVGNPGYNVTGLNFNTTAGIGWSSTGNWWSAPDTVLSRISAGVVGVGTTAIGTSNGTLIAGSVGIGTASPIRQLEIKGLNSVAAGGQMMIGDGGGDLTGKQLWFGYDTTADFSFFQSIHQGSAITPIIFQPNAGSVGIGTTSPLMNLDVKSAGGDLSGATVTYPTQTTGIILDMSTNSNNIGSGIWFDSGALKAGIASARAATTTWGTDLRFYVHPDAISNQHVMNEVMRITPSGNVGIGGTPSGALLNISPTDQTTAAYGLKFGTDTNLYRSAANTLMTDDNLAVAGNLSLNTDGAYFNMANFSLRSNGGGMIWNMVGGGATNFQVSGGAYVARGFIFTDTAARTYTSGSTKYFQITPNYNEASGTAANTDLLINRTETAVGSGLQFLIDAQVNNVSKFNVTNTGNVGIGGTPSGALLNISPTDQITADYGLKFGTDTNLYRSAANTLKTDDSFIVGTNMTVNRALTLTNPIENYNVFNEFKLQDSIGSNLLVGKAPKLKVSIDGVENTLAATQLTTQNFENYAGETKGVDGDSDHVINIDLATNGLGVVIYAAGKVVLDFYSTGLPSTYTARVRDMYGTWTAMTLTAQSTGGGSGWQLVGTIPIGLYLDNLEFTLGTGTGPPYIAGTTKWALTQVSYYANRMTLAQGGLLTSVGGYLGGNLTIGKGVNIDIDTVTGTTIGSPTSKLGFFGQTGIVQPANTVGMDTLLTNLGLRASGGTPKIDGALTVTGVLTASSTLTASSGLNVTGGLTANSGLSIPMTSAEGAIVVQSTTGTNATWIRMNNTGGNFYIGQDSSTGTRLNSISLPYAGTMLTESAYPLAFATNNVTRMVIDGSTGYVGIGGVASGALLNISPTDQTTAAYGLKFGTDANLYRSAADILSSDDKLDPASLNLQVKAGVPLDADIIGGAASGDIVLDTSDNRLYVRNGATWMYSAITAGFQIPTAEAYSYDFASQSFDISKPIKEGDLLIPFADKMMSDGAMHGLYTTFDSVKQTMFDSFSSDFNQLADNYLSKRSDTALTKIDNMELSLNSLTTRVDALSLNGDYLKSLKDSLLIKNTGSRVELSILKDLVAKGSLTVSGDATFGGNIEITGHIKAGTDTAGKAKILAGQNKIKVEFDKEYVAPPIITATPISSRVSYQLQDITTKDFVIELNDPTASDLEFNWIAVESN